MTLAAKVRPAPRCIVCKISILKIARGVPCNQAASSGTRVGHLRPRVAIHFVLQPLRHSKTFSGNVRPPCAEIVADSFRLLSRGHLDAIVESSAQSPVFLQVRQITFDPYNAEPMEFSHLIWNPCLN